MGELNQAGELVDEKFMSPWAAKLGEERAEDAKFRIRYLGPYLKTGNLSNNVNMG